jgi:hypothetical protein
MTNQAEQRAIPIRRAYGFMASTLLIGLGLGLITYPSLPYPAIVAWGLFVAALLIIVFTITYFR